MDYPGVRTGLLPDELEDLKAIFAKLNPDLRLALDGLYAQSLADISACVGRPFTTVERDVLRLVAERLAQHPRWKGEPLHSLDLVVLMGMPQGG